MRKLASIVEIEDIHKIENADLIEFITIKDKAWKCVCKKSEFKSGDLAVYFEIDSFLPKKEPFLFLEGRCNKTMNDEEGYRLKTIKLRGQISQGMVLPVNLFEELKNVTLNDDVTEILGVKLYEAPIPACLAGEIKGYFPIIFPKSDEERIQNIYKTYSSLYKNELWEVSIKMDGTSCSIYNNDNIFGVCSKNLELKESDTNTYWSIAKKYNIKERLELCSQKYSDCNFDITIQGEICGNGIQKNRDKIIGHEYFIFNIFDIKNYRYLNCHERLKYLDMLNSIDCDGLKLKQVPILGIYDIFNDFKTFDDLMEFSNGISYNENNIREGIVCKMISNPSISFKVINNKYLLKHSE